MQKYAVLQLGSKQFLVREGDVIAVERQKQPLSCEVLFYADEQVKHIGTPFVSDGHAKLSLIEETVEKTLVKRFKSKSRYHKVNGHKQPMSLIRVEGLYVGKEETKAKEVKAETPVKVEAGEKKPTKPTKVIKETVPAKEAVKEKAAPKKVEKKASTKLEKKSK